MSERAERSIRGGGFIDAPKGLTGFEAFSARRNVNLYNNLIARDRRSEEQKADDAEFERDDELACKALGKLTGKPDSIFRAAINLSNAEPDFRLEKALKQVISCDGAITGELLKALEGAIRKYDDWLVSAKKNETFVDLASRTFGDEEVKGALRSCGARYFTWDDDDLDIDSPSYKPPKKVFYDEWPEKLQSEIVDLECEHTLTHSFPECLERFNDYQNGGNTQAKAFLKWAREISDLDPYFQKKLIERFNELAIESDDLKQKAPEALFSSLFKYRLSKNLAFSEACLPALEAVQPLAAEIRKVKQLGGQEVFMLLGGGENISLALQSILPRVEQAALASPNHMRDVVPIIQVAAPDERHDLFDSVLKIPEIMGLLRAVRKYSICNDVETIFKCSALFERDQDKTKKLLEDLAVIKKLDGRLLSLAYMLNADEQLLSDPAQRQKPIDLIHKYPKSHLILPLYLKALGSNDETLLGIVTTALEIAKNGEELMTIATRLEALDQGTLAEGLQRSKGDVKSFIGTLLSKRYGSSAPVQSTPQVQTQKVTGHRAPHAWIDTLLSEFESGKITNKSLLSVAEVRAAYEALRQDFPTRLRTVWRFAPKVVSDCCADVLRFRKQPWFEQMLRDPYLFDRYIDKLKTDRIFTRRYFEAAEMCPTEAVERELREWLGERPNAPLPVELKVVHSIDHILPPSVASARFDRIILWGRFHSSARTEKLQEAAHGMPLILEDCFDRRVLGNRPVKSGDLVICMTRTMSHKQYYNIKRATLSSGATLVHTEREGTELLVHVIEQIAANRAA